MSGAALRAVVFAEVGELEGGFFGQACCGPDLPVRVWVGAAHGRAFVFEDLHVLVLGVWGGEILRGGR